MKRIRKFLDQLSERMHPMPELRARMKVVQDNIEMYKAILNMPPRVREKGNIPVSHKSTVEDISNSSAWK